MRRSRGEAPNDSALSGSDHTDPGGAFAGAYVCGACTKDRKPTLAYGVDDEGKLRCRRCIMAADASALRRQRAAFWTMRLEGESAACARRLRHAWVADQFWCFLRSEAARRGLRATVASLRVDCRIFELLDASVGPLGPEHLSEFLERGESDMVRRSARYLRFLRASGRLRLERKAFLHIKSLRATPVPANDAESGCASSDPARPLSRYEALLCSSSLTPKTIFSYLSVARKLLASLEGEGLTMAAAQAYLSRAPATHRTAVRQYLAFELGVGGSSCREADFQNGPVSP